MAKEDRHEWERLRKRKMLAIDDLGIEERDVHSYGNVMSPIVELLTYCYDKQLFTIISTNLTPPEIRAKYGDRIANRLNEMMVKIVFAAPSYRN